MGEQQRRREIGSSWAGRWQEEPMGDDGEEKAVGGGVEGFRCRKGITRDDVGRGWTSEVIMLIARSAVEDEREGLRRGMV
eukprot:2040845-Rhodomonas_salina.6